MENKNTALAFILVVCILAVSLEVPVSAQIGCLDACQTGCVQPAFPRLTARCERKCQIRCGPDGVGQNSGGNV